MAREQTSSAFPQCYSMLIAMLLIIITLYCSNYEVYIPHIAKIDSTLVNRMLTDNYSKHKSNSMRKCTLLIHGCCSKVFEFYNKDTFDFTTHRIKWRKGQHSWLIKSKVDIDNNIDRNLRVIIGNEMCRTDLFLPNTEKYGPHSTLIAHVYYDEKKDGNSGNMAYWKSLDNRTTFSPIYIPSLFKDQFSDDFETDILPYLLNIDKYPWGNRTFIIMIAHGVHTAYRGSLTTFLQDKIGKNPNYKSFVKIENGWAEDNRRKKWLNTTQYRAVLLKSKFTLCIYGNTAESHRLWETMAMGSIPVISVQNTNYRRRKCSSAFNGLLLFPNRTLSQIQKNGLIWNTNISNWYYADLDVDKLLHLNATKQFVAPILLRSDYDLEPFLDFVALSERKKPQKSKEFWNVYQQLMNQWFMNYVEYKMTKMGDIVLSLLNANCSLK